MSIAENILTLRRLIHSLEDKYGRASGSVQLIAISKTRPASAIREAHEVGQVDFGENYLQEALDKIAQCRDLNLCWHFIGPIQSNKTRAIAENFPWVHSVDRFRIARRLAEQRPADLPPLQILLQVNISGEASKSGAALHELDTLADQISSLQNLRLRGLMAIPAPVQDFTAQRRQFRQLAAALKRLQEAGFSQCDQLSMGMSSDFEAAIAEGATMIRIGTDIFGPRI